MNTEKLLYTVPATMPACTATLEIWDLNPSRQLQVWSTVQYVSVSEIPAPHPSPHEPPVLPCDFSRRDRHAVSQPSHTHRQGQKHARSRSVMRLLSRQLRALIRCYHNPGRIRRSGQESGYIFSIGDS